MYIAKFTYICVTATYMRMMQYQNGIMCVHAEPWSIRTRIGTHTVPRGLCSLSDHVRTSQHTYIHTYIKSTYIQTQVMVHGIGGQS